MIDRTTVVFVSGANHGPGVQFVARLLPRVAGKVYAASRAGPVDIKDTRVVPVTLDPSDDETVTHAARATLDTTLLIKNAEVNRQSSFILRRTSTMRAFVMLVVRGHSFATRISVIQTIDFVA
ncbi:Rossmann-fold NAD(P)-binding domain-containing protein [Paraburkholderia mimosarum]|uniref:hypothetical protein n=1 Tax=Paraburkholderia mimosarum TaxID=312026 RepID=UPI00040D6596|nr:hypothetical protein [Paraburkholderia mimosarum]